MKPDEYVDLENKDKLFHRFLICPLITGLSSIKVLIYKRVLLLHLLDRSKNFLEIKVCEFILIRRLHSFISICNHICTMVYFNDINSMCKFQL